MIKGITKKATKALALAFQDKDSWETVETLEEAGFTEKEIKELGFEYEWNTVHN